MGDKLKNRLTKKQAKILSNSIDAVCHNDGIFGPKLKQISEDINSSPSWYSFYDLMELVVSRQDDFYK